MRNMLLTSAIALTAALSSPALARPMTEVVPTDADKAETRRIFREVVLPGWVRRCGARCGAEDAAGLRRLYLFCPLYR